MKIKALGIAPYESMKYNMERLVEKYEQIDLDVYIGDLKKGVEIVQKVTQDQYDVIISRGGTAELIKKISEIPVVEVDLSVYDILRAIKMAEIHSSKYAIVGFSSLTKNAQIICDLLQFKASIITLRNESDAEPALKEIKGKGYNLILCDMISSTIAKRIGLNSILVTSGNESIENAFSRAIELCSSYNKIKERKLLYEKAFKYDDTKIFIFNENQELIFSSLDIESDELTNFLKKRVIDAFEGSIRKSYHIIGERVLNISGSILTLGERSYIVFFVNSIKSPLNIEKGSLTFLNKKEAEEKNYKSIFCITNSMSDIYDNPELIYRRDLPVMISGEESTGQDEIARDIYIHSTKMHNPFIIIDCSTLSKENMYHITDLYESPLYSDNNTIYIKNVNYLSTQRCKSLLSFIESTSLYKKCRLIFSCSYFNNTSFTPPHNIFKEILNELSCITIYTTPLRERSKDLPLISSLYLNNLNVELNKQIIGFEPEAMKFLTDYSWPGNYNQFKRLINELVLISSSPYIKLNSVKKVIEKENSDLPADQNTSQKYISLKIGKNKTLEEINSEIIEQILNYNNGNQSLTAKQLGISRTTLWRYLKRN